MKRFVAHLASYLGCPVGVQCPHCCWANKCTHRVEVRQVEWINSALQSTISGLNETSTVNSKSCLNPNPNSNPGPNPERPNYNRNPNPNPNPNPYRNPNPDPNSEPNLELDHVYQ